jgi:hypothetical protein
MQTSQSFGIHFTTCPDKAKDDKVNKEEVRLAIGNSYKELQIKRKLLSAKAVKDLYLGE